MAGTSGKQILPGWTRDSLPGPATRYSQDLVTCFESAWRERMWQLRSQEGIEHLNEAYMAAPKGSRVKSRGAECPKPTIWRRRFGAGARGPTLQVFGLGCRYPPGC